MDMEVQRVYSHPLVEENIGKVAIQRGPIVHCLEEVDNEYSLFEINLSRDSKFFIEYHPGLLGGITTLSTKDTTPLKFIPYFAWDNSGQGSMIVWIKKA